MLETEKRQVHPRLKELVVEASRALARLDADRLEELALSCQALNRNFSPTKAEGRAALAAQAKESAADMAVFARVLEATRANLNVMNRIEEFGGNRLEYGQGHNQMQARMGSVHGDN